MEPVRKISTAAKDGVCALLCNCRDASRLQSEALDKKLSFWQRWGLSLHLLICKWCRRYGKQVRFLRDSLQEHTEELTEAVPQNFSAEARERIRERMRSAK